MATLYLREHEDSARAAGQLAGIDYDEVLAALFESREVGDCSQIGQASHAVVHLDNDQLIGLKNEWLKTPVVAPEGLVVLRLSVGGRSTLYRLPHEKWTHSSGVPAFLINARNLEDTLDGDVDTQLRTLRAFVSAPPSFATKVVDNEDASHCEDVLRILLSPQRYPETLAALALLCQGFIATAAVSTPTNDADVQAALSRMGWNRELEVRFAAQLRSVATEVRTGQYWGMGSALEHESLLASASSEWGKKEAFEAVSSLIAALPSPKTRTAARAYLALADRLSS